MGVRPQVFGKLTNDKAHLERVKMGFRKLVEAKGACPLFEVTGDTTQKQLEDFDRKMTIVHIGPDDWYANFGGEIYIHRHG